jgi:phosphoglycolate phosphatase-like HAD superfamily hydrolase
MLPRRPRLLRRVALARRLAAGLDPTHVARAAGCPDDLLATLLAEESFQEIVQGWRELLALDPEARTLRLTRLAQLVLEEALERRSLPAALFTLAHALRGRDPVCAVTGGLERAVERARVEAARLAEARPADPRPAQAPTTSAPSRAAAERPHPDPLAALCHRTGASLRAAIVVEQGRGGLDRPLPPPATDDPLGAAVHALHRAADAAATQAPAPASAGPAPHAPPAPDRPRPAPALVDALTDQLLAKLARAGPAERLALERLDDHALDRLARTLLRRPLPTSPAQPQGP